MNLDSTFEMNDILQTMYVKLKPIKPRPKDTEKKRRKMHVSSDEELDAKVLCEV